MGKGAASRGSEGFVVWEKEGFPACMGMSSGLEPSERDLLPGYGAHPIDPALGFGQSNASTLQIWSLQQEENHVGCSCFCWHCIDGARGVGTQRGKDAGQELGRTQAGPASPKASHPIKPSPTSGQGQPQAGGSCAGCWAGGAVKAFSSQGNILGGCWEVPSAPAQPTPGSQPGLSHSACWCRTRN